MRGWSFETESGCQLADDKLPPLPQGFELETEPPELPEGFELDGASAPPASPTPEPAAPRISTEVNVPRIPAASVTQGLTAGFGDELSGLVRGAGAAVGSLFTEEDIADAFRRGREEGEEEFRNLLAQEREQSELGALASEVGGAIVSPIGVGAKALAGATRLGRVGQAVVAGGLEGAAFGAGSEEATALEGAATGAALGGAIAKGAQLAQRVGKRLADTAARKAVKTLNPTTRDLQNISKKNREVRKQFGRYLLEERPVKLSFSTGVEELADSSDQLMKEAGGELRNIYTNLAAASPDGAVRKGELLTLADELIVNPAKSLQTPDIDAPAAKAFKRQLTRLLEGVEDDGVVDVEQLWTITRQAGKKAGFGKTTVQGVNEAWRDFRSGAVDLLQNKATEITGDDAIVQRIGELNQLFHKEKIINDLANKAIAAGERGKNAVKISQIFSALTEATVGRATSPESLNKVSKLLQNPALAERFEPALRRAVASQSPDAISALLFQISQQDPKARQALQKAEGPASVPAPAETP